jgi:regulator of sigma E protease
MELLSTIADSGLDLFLIILRFVVVLTVVVFIHELGHFLVARWNGVDCEAFSIGFGPELFGWNDKNNCRWKVCAVPLGGYVKFIGDANAASMPDFEGEAVEQLTEREKAGRFEHKRISQKAAVVAAGPIANFILAIAIFSASFYFVGRYVSDPIVSEVLENSAAEEAGFEKGDIILKIDGEEVTSFSDIPRAVAPNHGIEMTITVEREGKTVDIPVTPRLSERVDRFGTKQQVGLLGISSKAEDSNVRKKEYGLIEAIGAGTYETYFVVERTLQYIKGIFTGRESADQISGPIGIANTVNDFWSEGVQNVIILTAILSVSIGLLNLFPIPILDGGHLVFYAYEAIFGKPVNARFQELSFRFGFILLMGLMLFATNNDLVREFFS